MILDNTLIVLAIIMVPILISSPLPESNIGTLNITSSTRSDWGQNYVDGFGCDPKYASVRDKDTGEINFWIRYDPGCVI